MKNKIKDTVTKNSIVMYEHANGQVELRADVEHDTIWATQEQIASLFDASKQTISRHLLRIFAEQELHENSVVKEYLTTAQDGKKYKVQHYNLDAIIAVGYRVNSKKATQFRIWATGVLREYLTRGYALNTYRINKSPESLVGLYQAVTLLESLNKKGTLKGKITLKLTETLESGK